MQGRRFIAHPFFDGTVLFIIASWDLLGGRHKEEEDPYHQRQGFSEGPAGRDLHFVLFYFPYRVDFLHLTAYITRKG